MKKIDIRDLVRYLHNDGISHAVIRNMFLKGFFQAQKLEAQAELKRIEAWPVTEFTADLETLDYSRESLEEELERYKLALEQKDAWDKLSEEEKDIRFYPGFRT